MPQSIFAQQTGYRQRPSHDPFLAAVYGQQGQPKQYRGIGARPMASPSQPLDATSAGTYAGRLGMINQRNSAELDQARQLGIMPRTYPTPLMTNEQAQTQYGQSGYQPNVTVGGAFGQRQYGRGQPRSDLTLEEMLKYGDAGEQSQANEVVTRNLLENRDGTHFGGAVPGISNSYGRPRVAFMDPLQQALSGGGMTPQQAVQSQMQAIKGTNKDGYLIPTASGQGLDGRGYGSMFPINDERQATLDANRSSYQQRRQMEMNQRQAGVQQNAMNVGNARRDRMGVSDPFEAALRGNPRLAMQYGAQQQDFFLQQAGLAQKGQLGMAEQQAKQQQVDAETLGGLIGLHGQIRESDPAMAAQIMQRINGLLGQQMFGGGAAAGGQGKAAGDLSGVGSNVPGHLRGLVTPDQWATLERYKADPRAQVSELRKMGLSPEKINLVLNKFHNPDAWRWSRTGENPGGTVMPGYPTVDAAGNEEESPLTQFGQWIASPFVRRPEVVPAQPRR